MAMITINDADINEAVEKHNLEVEVSSDPDFDHLQCAVIFDSDSQTPVAMLFEIDLNEVSEYDVNRQLRAQLVEDGLI